MVIRKERLGIEKNFYDLALKVLKKEGIELYDLDYIESEGLLRLFIMNKETESATFDDCVRIDKAMTPFIEDESWMPESLTLEVSSPGIDRGLRTLEHFSLSLERGIIVTCRDLRSSKDSASEDKVFKQKKIRGILKIYNKTMIGIESKNFCYLLKYDELKKANLDPDSEKNRQRY